MPWKECHIVDERVRFVARLLDGEQMAGLCKEFGISRKTGYKIYDRYRDHGALGLTDRSRRPYRHANQLPLPIEAHIVRLKREYPTWGAPKIRARLRRKYPRPPLPGDQHGPRRPGSPRPGRAARPASLQGQGDSAVTPRAAERALVRRLQRGIHARRSAILLPPHDHRFRDAVSLALRGAGVDQGGARLHGL